MKEVCLFVCVCAHTPSAFVRACVRECVRACVCMCVCVNASAVHMHTHTHTHTQTHHEEQKEKGALPTPLMKAFENLCVFQSRREVARVRFEDWV